MRKSRHSVSLGTFGMAFAIALSPALMQDNGLTFSSCKTGDTRLSELAIEVSGQDQVTSFDPDLRIYDVWLSSSVDSALVRAIPIDLGSQVWVNYYSDTLLAHRAQEKHRIARYYMLCRLGREPERAFMSAMRRSLAPGGARLPRRSPLLAVTSDQATVL